MRIDRRFLALLTAGICALGVPMEALAADYGKVGSEVCLPEKDAEQTVYDFAARVYGPGVNNLSASDPYARYQWGLRNDAEMQYVEVVNRFRDSNPRLAYMIDLANLLGVPAQVPGPDAYELEETNAVRGVDINVQPAWELYDSSTEEHREVIVAVIDTGIDITHPELKDAIWVNEDEIPDDGIDNDGNGFVDDVYGWNFFHNSNQVYVGKEDDHGTHAAGTIAALRGDMGIAGIADQKYVKIMCVKALGLEEGVGEEQAVIDAIHYAEDNGAQICNLSFGTLEYYPRLEQTMRESNMLFITAAGNGDSSGYGVDVEVYPDYPACFRLDNLISVANLMFDGNLAKSSNYGASTIDIAAPGTYIVSTITNHSYGFMTGTSMAAPMVTGVAAMLYSYRTDLELKDIKTVLVKSAKKLEGLNGKVVSGGVVDAYAAMTYGRETATATPADAEPVSAGQ